jgi:hypothetical protein
MLTVIFWHRKESYVHTDITKDNADDRKTVTTKERNVFRLTTLSIAEFIQRGYGIMTRYSGGTWRKPCHSEPSHMKW